MKTKTKLLIDTYRASLINWFKWPVQYQTELNIARNALKRAGIKPPTVTVEYGKAKA